MAARNAGMVYLIQAEGTPRVKIGWTNNLKKRLQSLKTGCPYPVKVVTTIAAEDSWLERELHQMYADYRVHGEWFELPDTVIEFLEMATEMSLLSVQIADFLLKKDLSGFYSTSKIEEIRRECVGVLDGCGV